MASHSLLLNRLQYCFGIQGSALSWIKSYLEDCTQHIVIDDPDASQVRSTDMTQPVGYHKEVYLDQFCSTYKPYHWEILPEIMGYSFMHMAMTNKPISASSLPSRVQQQNVLTDFINCIADIRMDVYQPFKT